MKWSFIVFCYNEENTIKDVIIDCNAFLEERFEGNGEIIFVNDGSTDNSLINVQKLKESIPQLKIISSIKNQGIGPTLNLGYDAALGEYICAVPGDGQFAIKELYQLNDFDATQFVSFYRIKKNYSFYRNLLTRGNYIYNLVFNKIYLKDVNWIKVYKKVQLDSIERELKSSLVESEIVGKLLNKKIAPIEIPSQYHLRTYGKPKGGNLKTLFFAVKEIVKLIKVIKTP